MKILYAFTGEDVGVGDVGFEDIHYQRVESMEDAHKLAGMEFNHFIYAITVPDDAVKYLKTRVRRWE